MTTQSTERLSARRKDTPGTSRQAGSPKRAFRHSRQKAAGSVKTPVAYFLVFLFLMNGAFLHWAQVYGSTLQLHMQDNLLSLKAVDVDLGTILQRLGQAAGIDFKFPKELEIKITLQLSGVGLETALQRILRGLNYATVYSVTGSGEANSISAVYIYGKHKAGARTSQSISREPEVQHSTSDYEKRIRVVQQRLDKLERDSPAARRYQKEIEIYQRLIDRLKKQR